MYLKIGGTFRQRNTSKPIPSFRFFQNELGCPEIPYLDALHGVSPRLNEWIVLKVHNILLYHTLTTHLKNNDSNCHNIIITDLMTCSQCQGDECSYDRTYFTNCTSTL